MTYNTKEFFEKLENFAASRQCGKSGMQLALMKRACEALLNNEETFEFGIQFVEVDISEVNF